VAHDARPRAEGDALRRRGRPAPPRGPAAPRNGEDRDAIYVDVTASDGQATARGQHLAKGRRVAMSGRLEFSEWTTSEGGAACDPQCL
jgi:hypothetical protein